LPRCGQNQDRLYVASGYSASSSRYYWGGSFLVLWLCEIRVSLAVTTTQPGLPTCLLCNTGMLECLRGADPPSCWSCGCPPGYVYTVVLTLTSFRPHCSAYTRKIVSALGLEHHKHFLRSSCAARQCQSPRYFVAATRALGLSAVVLESLRGATGQASAKLFAIAYLPTFP
jgi:hypothetical protein